MYIFCSLKDMKFNYSETVTCDSTKSHTHTRRLHGPCSGTTRVSRYQKDTTNLDFTETRDSE